ncbi:LuxR family transcriptional regulator [Gordonibacter sp. An230]|uniref:LuxR family transcriptional regulator n=1 Tax=Gordonibacter sp. An230 TaxID=1965592 RepID=UPI001EF599CB|nr:LuxR family transcriptional regulator [Gordonibacter sp. An230]
MPEVKGKRGEARPGVVRELVSLWPSLPYLGYGVWLAWACLAYSGTLWLSDVETNGENLSQLYMVSTAAFGIVCLVVPFAVRRFAQLLERRGVVVGAGACAAVGCVFVVAVGPYYLGQFAEMRPLFWLGAALSGIGTGVVGLKCGVMYGSLPPRRVLLYAATSQIVVAFIYFAVIGSPPWALAPGGPSVVGILSFTLLPVAAALLTVLPTPPSSSEAGVLHLTFGESKRALPGAFWRLVALSFLLPAVASMMRGVVVDAHALAVTLEGNNILMLLRVLMAAVFVVVAVRVDASHMNFGKLYSLIAICMVVTIACVPVFGAQSNEWSLLIYCASSVFEFVMWCLLAFVVFQKRISPIIVFGIGRGAFMLGSAIGWSFGVYALPSISGGGQLRVRVLHDMRWCGVGAVVRAVLRARLRADVFSHRRERAVVREPDGCGSARAHAAGRRARQVLASA